MKMYVLYAIGCEDGQYIKGISSSKSKAQDLIDANVIDGYDEYEVDGLFDEYMVVGENKLFECTFTSSNNYAECICLPGRVYTKYQKETACISKLDSIKEWKMTIIAQDIEKAKEKALKYKKLMVLNDLWNTVQLYFSVNLGGLV